MDRYIYIFENLTTVEKKIMYNTITEPTYLEHPSAWLSILNKKPIKFLSFLWHKEGYPY